MVIWERREGVVCWRQRSKACVGRDRKEGKVHQDHHARRAGDSEAETVGGNGLQTSAFIFSAAAAAGKHCLSLTLAATSVVVVVAIMKHGNSRACRVPLPTVRLHVWCRVLLRGSCFVYLPCKLTSRVTRRMKGSARLHLPPQLRSFFIELDFPPTTK